MAKIEIDKERCKGCGLCTISCPKELIRIGEEINRQGYFFILWDDCEMEMLLYLLEGVKKGAYWDLELPRHLGQAHSGIILQERGYLPESLYPPLLGSA